MKINNYRYHQDFWGGSEKESGYHSCGTIDVNPLFISTQECIGEHTVDMKSIYKTREISHLLFFKTTERYYVGPELGEQKTLYEIRMNSGYLVISDMDIQN